VTYATLEAPIANSHRSVSLQICHEKSLSTDFF
jgi:hypothetical protein